MNIIDRVKAILLRPVSTWAVIEAEPATPAGLYRNYLVWLAAIPAVCGFIGMSVFGISVPGVTVRVPLMMGLVNMVVSYVLSLAGVYVLALIVDALAPSFGGTRSPIQALKLAVYASTAALVGGVFSLIPLLAVLGLLAALYSVYLIYTGLPVLMKNPPGKSLLYTVVVVLAGIVVSLVIAWAGRIFMPHPATVGAAAGGVSISTPDGGKVSIDSETIKDAIRKMEEAARDAPCHHATRSSAHEVSMTNISMYQASVPRLARLLGNLAGILDKAQAHVDAGKIDEQALMDLRLIADMYPFSKQVQIACDKARSVVARLAGMDVPRYEDKERTLAELKGRIARTIAFLESVPADKIDGTEDHDIELPVTGKPTVYKGLQLLLGHSMPNVYFHTVTAYNILRQNGVPIGKRDFLGNP